MLGEGGRFSSAPRLANLSLFDVRTPAPDASSQLFDVDVLYAPGPGASVLLSLNRLDVDAENIFATRFTCSQTRWCQTHEGGGDE